MTNGEKYKTAQERAEAFREFCLLHTNFDKSGKYVMCQKECPVFNKTMNGRNELICFSYWLDLEAEDEKPLPCPFCGGMCAINGSGKVYQVACKSYCGYVSMKTETEEDAIAAHNRVAKKCREEVGCNKYCHGYTKKSASDAKGDK